MKKLPLLILLLVQLMAAQAQQVPQTPNLGLNLPPQGTPNWATLLNQNFIKIDTAMWKIDPSLQISWPALTCNGPTKVWVPSTHSCIDVSTSGGSYPGCITDGSNGITCTGNVQAASYNGVTYLGTPDIGKLLLGISPTQASWQSIAGTGLVTASSHNIGRVPIFNNNIFATIGNSTLIPTNPAPVGHYLRGNGTDYLDSAIQLSDLPSGVGGYPGVTSDSANGLAVTGQVAAGNVVAPLQPQTSYKLVATYTAIAKMGSPANQVRIIIIGDSTAGAHNSALAGTIAANHHGVVGIINAGTTNSTTGTVVLHDIGNGNADYTVSPTGAYYDMSPGSCITFGQTGGSFKANLLAGLYVQEPGAGTLTMNSVKDLGYAFDTPVTIATVSANGVKSGQVLQYTYGTSDRYALQFCVSGSNVKFYAPAMIDTTANGIIWINEDYGGLRFADYVSTPAAATAAWDAFRNPDLVLSKWAGNGVDPATCNYLDTAGNPHNFKALWDTWSNRYLPATNPILRDFVTDGSYSTNQPTCTAQANLYEQQWSALHHKIYYDGLSMVPTVAEQIALGWLTVGDQVHQTPVGQQAQSTIYLADLIPFDYTGITTQPVRTGSMTTPSFDLTRFQGDVGPDNPSWLHIDGYFDVNMTLNRDLFINGQAGYNNRVLTVEHTGDVSTGGTNFSVGCDQPSGCPGYNVLYFKSYNGAGGGATNGAIVSAWFGDGMQFIPPRDIATKGFYFYNHAGNAVRFFIDSTNGKVTTTNQTIDDGAGNASFYGNVSVASGTNIMYRCTTAGTLPVGALTIDTGNCGASTDTGLRVK